MNIIEELKRRISFKSENILLVFPNERLKRLFKFHFKPSEKIYILLTTGQIYYNGLIGRRFKEYKFIDWDTFEQMGKEILGDK